jgi:hypothetical protein
MVSTVYAADSCSCNGKEALRFLFFSIRVFMYAILYPLLQHTHPFPAYNHIIGFFACSYIYLYAVAGVRFQMLHGTVADDVFAVDAHKLIGVEQLGEFFHGKIH